MDKGGGSQPAAPDPTTLIQQQKDANRINVVTPNGSATYGAPNDTLTISESPFQQQQRQWQQNIATSLSNPAQQIAGNLSGAPFDFANLPQYRYQFDASQTPQMPGVVAPGALTGAGSVNQGAGGDPSQGGNVPSNMIQYGVDATQLNSQLPLAQRANEFQDYGQQGQELEQATYQRGLNLIKPEMDTARARLEQQLVNRGLPLNSKAAMTELDRLDRSQQSQLENLGLTSVGAGRQEQGRLFGQDVTKLNTQAGIQNQLFGQDTTQNQLRNNAQNTAYQQAMGSMGQQAGLRQTSLAEQQQQMNNQNQARQQALSEQQLNQNQQLNMLQAIMGVTPSFQLPNFPSPSQVDVTGPAYANYQAQLNSYNQGQAQRNSALGGLYGLGGALGSAALISSRTLKTSFEPVDPDKIAVALEGMPVWKWRYRFEGGDHIGPMAEDFRDAFGIGDGLTIDVATAIGVLVATNQALLRRVAELEKKVA